MQAIRAKKRLLVLDVDNTLLHVPVYDPLLYLLADLNISEEEFYRNLPDGGDSIDGDPHLKVYPRPHLTEFLDKAESLGYDLALCTTATKQYIDTVLPLCGVSLERFVSVVCREELSRRGLQKVKDVRPLVSAGYKQEDIVVIDDRDDIHLQASHVIKIPSFEVRDDSFLRDDELLIMIDRLEYLGNKSLPEMRRLQRMEREREDLVLRLATEAFDSNKYRDLPFDPEFFLRRSGDIEQHPACEEVEELSLDRFLIYKDFGLVGAVEKNDDSFLINNYCPEIWTDVPGGVSRTGRNVGEISELFWFLSSSDLLAKCKAMGYNVSRDDFLTLAAVTLQSTHFGGMHILALSDRFIEDNPMSYD
ncbi:NIF family HAD-type phosphatase [Marinimicrobium sp. ABcell2]|uniref:NIF family HAD-type phosphatase n=1 Tax=Marinimicrobium sp. ABcell2 TaxID=3069751 RepID=UPI0027B104D9|nr:NIF family HAD-type phosphatase [Marinimicrobium sp. ABcell2]MDQ2077479.1 NIF family HAD-type phosphatase [Marinimicrobium sp. ABcell2]